VKGARTPFRTPTRKNKGGPGSEIKGSVTEAGHASSHRQRNEGGWGEKKGKRESNNMGPKNGRFKVQDK